MTLYIFVFTYITSVVKPVHIFMAWSRVSKSRLKAELCFVVMCIFLVFRYILVLLYIYIYNIYIYIYIYVYICYYTLKFNMCENQILQMLTLLNLPSLILAKIGNSLTWKIYICKNHQISIIA